MSRAIVGASSSPPVTRRGMDEDFPPTPTPGPEPDSYGDKLLKLIPAEVVGVYTSMTAILQGSGEFDPNELEIAYWTVFFFGVAATFLVMKYGFKVRERRQLILTVLSFCIWAYTLGGPFEAAGLYSGTVSGLLLAGYTFAVPKIPVG